MTTRHLLALDWAPRISSQTHDGILEPTPLCAAQQVQTLSGLPNTAAFFNYSLPHGQQKDETTRMARYMLCHHPLGPNW